jgi:hypothetical protein
LETSTGDMVRDLIEEMIDRLLARGYDIYAEWPACLHDTWIEINRFLLHIDLCEVFGDVAGIERNLEQVNRLLNGILEEVTD